jgi:Tfp pilus assembly protein PilF
VAAALLVLIASPGCVSAKRALKASGQVDLGTAYYREGDYEAAVAELRLANHTDPRNWRALNALAVTYIAKGQPDLAEDAFTQALRLNPDEAEILLNQGALQLNRGEVKEAIATFKHALDDLDYRNQAFILSNLSLALLQDGQTDQAVATARETVRRAPELCQGWFHLGLAQEARKDPVAAVEAYETVIKRCPQDSLGARLRSGCLKMDGLDPVYGQAALQQIAAEAPGTPFADEARSCLAHGGRG